MKPLSDHVLRDDLDVAGMHLVEASAGTGKTYSIETLFLRLVVVEGLPVKDILVVTFTEAATKELRERLRSILEACRRLLMAPDEGSPRDRIHDALALSVRRPSESTAPEHALDDDTLRERRLRRGLLDFDQAAISTIHGFCQRTLQEFAFECGHDFDSEVVTGDALLRQLCADWWRQAQYVQPGSISELLFRRDVPSVEELTRLAHEVIKRPKATVLPGHDETSRANAEQDLVERIGEGINLARENCPAIQADLEREEAARFFSDEAKDQVVRDLVELQGVEGSALPGAFPVLEHLASDLKPASLPNTYHPPSEVAACMAACAACNEMAQCKANQIGAKRGEWGVREDMLEEWETCVAVAVKTIADHRHAVDTFLGSPDLLRYYVRTDLTDPAIRQKRLQALEEGRPGRDLLTAIKRVGELKKRAVVSWPCATETDALRRFAGKVVASGAALARITLATGLRTLLARYDQAKREAHRITYDDMLQRLQEALERGEQATSLRKALRRKYRAALIDEFQDTDPVQYDIFRRIFLTEGPEESPEAEIPIFFVGDPKQAIYSFRGADVFTYCAAAATVPAANRYSLDKNFRSRAPLVDAVNTVFKDRREGSVFGTIQIGYADDLACNDLPTRFVDEGRLDPRPFKIWDYASIDPATPNPTSFNSVAARVVYADVANEIVRLLSSDLTGFVDHSQIEERGISSTQVTRLRASDIAVLVRRHAEAAYIYRELRARNVAAVRQAGDNVFDSAEAAELHYLLQAMLAPGSLSAVRTALASDLLPVRDAELVDLAAEKTTPCRAAERMGIRECPDSMDAWMLAFKECAELWRRKDFAVAFTSFMKRTGMKAWLASTPGGERRFMNIAQLHDLLHRAAAEGRLGPDALAAWFLRQLNRATREENAAFETRLESDADAVQIMTVFKSKGLEFPVVFAPTMWTEQVGTRMAVCRVYHDVEPSSVDSPPATKLPATFIHLDRNHPDARAAAKREANNEDVRNLYVATTRAAFRTYVVAGDLGSQSDGVLARCLPRERYTGWGETAPETGIEVCRRALLHRPGKWLASRTLGTTSALAGAGAASVDKSRRHASFSSLAPQGHGPGSESYDFDAQDASSDTEERRADGPVDIFSFPAGARTGECWHRMFELLDFASSEDTIQKTVNEQLGLFRLDRGDQTQQQRMRRITCDMVQRVLHARLEVGESSIRLADVPGTRRRTELAFDFCLRGSGAGAGIRNAIGDVLQRAWGNVDPGREEAMFLRRLQHWDSEIPAGFMTGFIDLFFEHDGRYYVLDWKSNQLSRQPEDFDRPGLVAEIAEQAYFLQYLIYTVAADLHLRTCLGDGYEYERDFGGVLYLFLRGVGRGQDAATQRGVFFTRPNRGLVQELARGLLPRADGEVGS